MGLGSPTCNSGIRKNCLTEPAGPAGSEADSDGPIMIVYQLMRFPSIIIVYCNDFKNTTSTHNSLKFNICPGAGMKCIYKMFLVLMTSHKLLLNPLKIVSL